MQTAPPNFRRGGLHFTEPEGAFLFLPAKVLRVSANPTEMKFDITAMAHRNNMINCGCGPKEFCKRHIVVEPLMFRAEGMNEQDCVRRTKTFGFKNGGHRSMQQLIAYRAGKRLGQPQFPTNKRQSFPLSRRCIDKPLLQSFAERLLHFALDGDGNQIAASTGKHPNIVLGRSHNHQVRQLYVPEERAGV